MPNSDRINHRPPPPCGASVYGECDCPKCRGLPRYEIRKCYRADEHGVESYPLADASRPEAPDFYSIYERSDGGTIRARADFGTLEEAREVLAFLEGGGA